MEEQGYKLAVTIAAVLLDQYGQEIKRNMVGVF